MKPYVKLTKDLSTLVAEVNAYLETQDIDSTNYQLQSFHRLGEASNFVDEIPSILTAFNDEELTIDEIGHWCVDNTARVVPCKTNLVIVPLANVDSSIFQTHELHNDALPYKDFVIDHIYYDSLECDLVESVEIDGNPIFVAQDTLHSILNTDNDLAQFLIIVFNEAISDYFTE